jgi:hypothetical protein
MRHGGKEAAEVVKQEMKTIGFDQSMKSCDLSILFLYAIILGLRIRIAKSRTDHKTNGCWNFILLVLYGCDRYMFLQHLSYMDLHFYTDR